MVNEQIFKGNWTEIRGKVKEKWGSLTDDDLILAEGKADQLIGVIQRRTGESREKIEHDLDQLVGGFGSKVEQVKHKASAVAASARSAAREYGDRANQGVHELADAARGQYGQLQQQARDQYGRASDAVQSGYADAQLAVRRNPMESVLVAFGAGIAAGVVVGLCFRPSR